MGSSAKTGKKFFRGSPEHFLDKNAIWDRTPPTYTSIAVYMCGEASRVPNLQTEFNYLDSFKSYGIFSDFVVPTWSLLSSRRPHPHIVPVIPLSSPHHPHIIPLSSPHHPHVIPVIPVIPIAPRRSPCGLHGLWSPHIVPVVPMSSPSSPRCPHIVPVITTLSPRRPHSPQKVPMWSPWSVVSTCCPRCPHVVPVIPTLFLLSPHHLEGPHIIPNPPDSHSTHPLPPWGSQISKNAIRFELIEIF